MDRIVNAISGDGMVRIRVLEGKNMVERPGAYTYHADHNGSVGPGYYGGLAYGLGHENEKDSLTLRLTETPAGQVLAVADSGGFVRGYVQRPAIDLPLNPQGKLDGRRCYGKPEDNLENKGTLTVIKDLGLKEPYVGQIDLVSGEIGDDVTAYLFQSEQIPSVCGLGVLVDTDCSVKVAGDLSWRSCPVRMNRLSLGGSRCGCAAFRNFHVRRRHEGRAYCRHGAEKQFWLGGAGA